MSISESCKAYERFHSTHYQDEPFPMSKFKLIRYIKFRARSGTFPDFLTNLDKHPLHGPEWLQEMNSDPDVIKLMDLTINLWPRIAKQCKLPLIGIGNVYETPSFELKYGKYIRDKVNQEAMYRERVHVVEGKKSRGFMVTDPSQHRPEDIGTSSDSPINLDHPTPSISPIQRSKSTTPSNSSSTASKYTPSTKYSATSTSSTSKTTTTTTTATFKSTTKYDPKIDEIALREELLQQMMMPNQMRLISQFKASSPSSVRSRSPSTPPASSKASAKREEQKSASPAEPPVKSSSSPKAKSTATKKEHIIQKKPPVTQKKNPTINKNQSDKGLWKLAQTVTVNIERPQEKEEEEVVLHHPVVKIVKRKPLHYGINDDIQPASKKASAQPEIRHPVVLIEKLSSRRKDTTVNIAKRDFAFYPQQQEDEEEEEEEEQDQEENITDEDKDDNSRNKRQKRGNYLYDQNRLQIVQIVIENHA